MPQGYTKGQRWLHWILAALILPMIVAGLVMVQSGLPRGLQNALFIGHKNIGTLVLILVVLRLALRLRRGAPALPDAMPALQRRLAEVSHATLYALMLLLPLSGYIRVRAGGFPIEALDRLGLPTLVPRSDTLAMAAKTVHEYGGYALMALLLAHIGAAVHHGLRRDGLWARIWPPQG